MSVSEILVPNSYNLYCNLANGSPFSPLGGPMGPPGVTGPTGPTNGLPGAPGPKGATGPAATGSGATGPTGATGAVGAQGALTQSNLYAQTGILYGYNDIDTPPAATPTVIVTLPNPKNNCAVTCELAVSGLWTAGNITTFVYDISYLVNGSGTATNLLSGLPVSMGRSPSNGPALAILANNVVLGCSDFTYSIAWSCTYSITYSPPY